VFGHIDFGKKLIAVGGVTFAVLSSGMAPGVGTACADGLAATPVPPAVIDLDGTHNYDNSAYPVAPSWPARPSWPSASTWGS
jgi:hypothetical protein